MGRAARERPDGRGPDRDRADAVRGADGPARPAPQDRARPGELLADRCVLCPISRARGKRSAEMSDRLRAVGEELLLTPGPAGRRGRDADEAAPAAPRARRRRTRSSSSSRRPPTTRTWEDQLAPARRAGGRSASRGGGVPAPCCATTRRRCATSSSTTPTWSRSAWDRPPRCEQAPAGHGGRRPRDAARLIDARPIVHHRSQWPLPVSHPGQPSRRVDRHRDSTRRSQHPRRPRLARPGRARGPPQTSGGPPRPRPSRRPASWPTAAGWARRPGWRCWPCWGAVAGWTTTAELLRPGEGPVHAALALLAIAGGPWLLLLLRSSSLLLLRRRASPVLGRLVTSRPAARRRTRRGGQGPRGGDRPPHRGHARGRQRPVSGGGGERDVLDGVRGRGRRDDLDRHRPRRARLRLGELVDPRRASAGRSSSSRRRRWRRSPAVTS